MEWYLLVFKRYAEFSGRSRRKEYWMFALINCIITWVPYLLGLGLLLPAPKLGMALLTLAIIYSLAMLIPGLAVSVRRLHDTGKTGWLLLIALIPIVGPIILLVFLCTDSQPTDNQYGPNPKAIAPVAVA